MFFGTKSHPFELKSGRVKLESIMCTIERQIAELFKGRGSNESVGGSLNFDTLFWGGSLNYRYYSWGGGIKKSSSQGVTKLI